MEKKERQNTFSAPFVQLTLCGSGFFLILIVKTVIRILFRMAFIAQTIARAMMEIASTFSPR